MQVKKFEAKSMKEALDMVKTQLGPEAIILSARDNSKGYGLMGQKSVEVTAAISDEVLRKKLVAESKLNAANRERYSKSPARVQRQFIREATTPPVREAPRPLTQQRYAEISDTPVEAPIQRTLGFVHPGSSARTAMMSTMDQPPTVKGTGYDQNPQLARARIKNAAKKALEAGLETMNIPAKPATSTAGGFQEIPPGPSAAQQAEIQALKNEIQGLKNLLEKFHSVPQNFLNLHPGADRGIPFELSQTYEKLVRAGFSENNTVEILKGAQHSLTEIDLKKPPHVEAWIVKFLLDHLKVVEHRNRAQYHVFVGPAGQGKTSSLVKFASQLVIGEKKKVAIVTIDTLKVGAAEQLKIYSQILNIPFAVIKKKGDWSLISEKLKQMDHIFIDSPGFNLRAPEEVQWIEDRLPSQTEGGRAIHYVQSVLAKDEDAFDIAQRYGALHFQDTIFTNLDESTRHGLIYNFQKNFGTPLHSFGIGPQMPEDFEAATKERVVDLIFKISKLRGRG
jgi:flagellar biosynthesis protein FlhF